MFSQVRLSAGITAGLLFALLLAAPGSAGAQIVVNAAHGGSYYSGGGHDANDPSYTAGRALLKRHYFVFDLSAVTGPIRRVQLRAFNPSGMNGGNYTVYDVSTPTAELTATQVNRTDIYADLGTGTPYASRAVAMASSVVPLEVYFNEAGLEAVRGALGGTFVIGGDIPENNCFYFGGTDYRNGAVQLVINDALAGDLIISEFRTRGPGGPRDEYVEIYNNTDTPYFVNSDGQEPGLYLSLGQPPDANGFCRVANVLAVPGGTVIPARGHYLIANDGYSLGAHSPPDRNPFGALELLDDKSLYLHMRGFVQTPLDRVGFAGQCGGAGEGTLLPQIGAVSDEHAWVRDLSGGRPKDTFNNAADFRLVSATGSVFNGVQSRLGAPGPEGMNSPVARGLKPSLIDSGCAGTSTGPSPNTTCARHRDTTPGAGNNSAAGTLSIRRRFTNSTGAPVTSLRFRVIDVTSGPVAAGTADLRARTSDDYMAVCVGTNGGCVPGRLVTVRGTTLEPPSPASNGGLNSTLSAGRVTLATPLAAGNSINVQFLLGVEQAGAFRFIINVEALSDTAASPAAPAKQSMKAGSRTTAKR